MQVPAGRGRVKMVNPMGGLVYVLSLIHIYKGLPEPPVRACFVNFSAVPLLKGRKWLREMFLLIEVDWCQRKLDEIKSS